MRIGLDFDNTIVSYSGVFHRAAVERGLIPDSVPNDKTAVRDHLRADGREEDWILLQGYVYGSRMDLAAPYPGVTDFLAGARARGYQVFVISHRTRHPFRGPQFDLHEEAQRFLSGQGLLTDAPDGLAKSDTFFELTKEEKLRRIAAQNCDLFVDDLPEFLDEPAFPSTTRKVLFDPHDRYATTNGHTRVRSWQEFSDLVL